VLEGYGRRDFNWDLSAEIQQELAEGISLTAGYYRNSGGYFRYAFGSPFSSKVRVTNNLLVGPEDYDHFCITAPRDPRLPNGGGYQVCGLYDIKPEKFGKVQNFITQTENFGEFDSKNEFIGATINARLANGGTLGGGFDTGRTVRDRCFIVDSPQEMLYCRVVTPFKAQTQFKVFGAYPIPGDFTASFTYENLSGPMFEAAYSATNAEIIPSLGRPLSGGLRNVTVPLVAPQTLFDDRIARLNVRVSKVIRVQRFRFQINVDAYNLLNANSVRNVNSVYGLRWQNPNQIMDPRLVQIGGQIDF